MCEQPANSQIRAWQSSVKILNKALGLLITAKPSVMNFGIIFEYELPRERGRRPDVVILSDREAIVLEFKESSSISQAYVDQATAYARDLLHYHAANHELRVQPVLVLSQSNRPASRVDDIDVVSGDSLLDFLRNSLDTEARAPDIIKWIESDYDPLPSIVSAARILFNHEPLPNIRRAQSAGIPQTIQSLINIAKQARSDKENHLAILTGVPGSGKTLAGLQLVYSDQIGSEDIRNQAVFLSGNGPLVEVLQHALKNKVFVQDVHGFLKQYGGNHHQTPSERVWIYDEAQRAWDANRARDKRGDQVSEPEDFLRIA